MVRAGASMAFGACLVLGAIVLADACAPYGESAAGDEPEAGAPGPDGAPDGCTGSGCACERDEQCVDPSMRCLSGVCVGASDASDDGPAVDAGPCAACPPGTARLLCVDGACVATRRVFVSSEGSTANLGGALGADEKCRTLATAARLGGVWKAWVAGPVNSVSDRFEKAVVPYRLLDGRTVAMSWDDLTDGILLNGIDRDELGRRVMTPVEVWTGTAEDGNPTAEGCGGFLTADASYPAAVVGITGRADHEWTNAYQQNCDRTGPRIYCFEQ